VRVPWALSDAPSWLLLIVLGLAVGAYLPYWIALLRERARRQHDGSDPSDADREP
jgi:hypothetical protein